MKRVKKRVLRNRGVQKAIYRNYNNKRLNLFRLEKLMERKNYEIVVQDICSLQPTKIDNEYKMVLAEAYINLKRYNEALIALQTIEANTDKYNKIMAVCYQADLQIELANKYWSKINNIDNLTINELLLAGRTAFKLSKYEQASKFFETAASKPKNRTELWTFLKKKGYNPEATWYLTNAIADGYDFKFESALQEAQQIFELGDMYCKFFEYESGYKWIKKAIEINPLPIYHYHLAGICQHLERYQEGIEYLENSKLVGTYDNHKATYLLGSLYYKLEDFDMCAKVFFENRPHVKITTHEVLTNKFYIQGLVAEANQDYKLAAELFTKAVYSYNGHCRLLFDKLGEMYYLAGNITKACENFMMYNISPDYPIYNLTSTGYAKDVINNSEYYDRLSVVDNFVLYTSYSGTSFSGSPYGIFKQLYEQEGLIHFVLYKTEENKNQRFEQMENVYYVEANSKLHRRISSQAKLIITNGTYPYAFIAKEEQILVNTWHGTPIKYLGYDVQEASYLLSRNVRNSLITSTHFIHPNQFTKDAMVNSFKLEGASDTKIEVTGYPRQDLMINITEERKAEIRQYLGIDESKKVVLYAPTYRDSLLVTGDQRDQPMIDACKRLEKNPQYNFLFKGHYFDENVKNKTNDIDTNELLSIVDVLISDYSSIAIDFMALNRPIIYFTYDLAEYQAERGFYFELNSITSSLVNTIDELEALIANQVENPVLDQKQIAAFDKFCYLDDGNAAKRVLELIANDSKPVDYSKESVLVYVGNLLSKGPGQEKFEQVIKTYNKDDYEITILLDESELKKGLDETYIDELIEAGYKITFYYGNLSRNIIENAAYNLYQKNAGFYNSKHKSYINTMMRRNAIRLFGRSKYDQLVVIENDNDRNVELMFESLNINCTRHKV